MSGHPDGGENRISRKEIIGIVFIILLLGVSLLLYSSSAEWPISRNGAGQSSEPENLTEMPPEEMRAQAVALAAAPGELIESDADIVDGRDVYFIQIRQLDDIRQIVVDARSGKILSNAPNDEDDGELDEQQLESTTVRTPDVPDG
tara:strand:- start:476 stop:913 length:438 start_codon:yes stop_codon:yes gene_type:complete